MLDYFVSKIQNIDSIISIITSILSIGSIIRSRINHKEIHSLIKKNQSTGSISNSKVNQAGRDVIIKMTQDEEDMKKRIKSLNIEKWSNIKNLQGYPIIGGNRINSKIKGKCFMDGIEFDYSVSNDMEGGLMLIISNKSGGVFRSGWDFCNEEDIIGFLKWKGYKIV